MPTPKMHVDSAARQRAYRKRRAADRKAELLAKGLPATAPIPTMPSLARWRALALQARALVEIMQDEMKAYADERSETWQESENGESFRERLERIEEARDALEGIP